MPTKQRLFWLNLICFYCLQSLMAQSPAYPSCAPSPSVPAVLEELHRLREPEADGVQIAVGQLRILREAISKAPEDFHLQRRLLAAAGGRFLDTLHRELSAAYAQKLSKQPDDPVLKFLYAQSLIGTRSGEALQLLEGLAAAYPALAWPHQSLAVLHGYPAFQDNAKMQAHAVAFLRLCPDSLETYDLLSRTSGEGLSETVSHLHSVIEGRTDAAAIRAWPHYWNLAFKVRPTTEHDNLRQQIGRDVATLRPSAEHDYFLLGVLLQGARLAGDSRLMQELETQQRGLLPAKAKVRAEYREWHQKNRYPAASTAANAVRDYKRQQVAMLNELLTRDPDNYWLLQEKLALLTEDEEVSVAQLEEVGERVLRAGKQWEEAWVSTPPALMVARAWAQRNVKLQTLPNLVAQGLAHHLQIERNDAGSDLLDAKTSAGERKEWMLRNRISSFAIAAEVYPRLGLFDKAREALAVMAAVLDTYRSDLEAFRQLPPDRTDRYRASLGRVQLQWEHSYWLRKAGLAKAEGQRLDALAYYASSLRTVGRMGNPGLRKEILTAAFGLWKELGGTLEGWQLWLDQSAALPAPSAAAEPRKSVELPAMEWTKVDRPLPAFRLRDLEGREHTNDDLKGRVTVVNVWATWCEPCRVELPLLQKLHDRLRNSNNARVVSYNVDVNFGLVTPFVAVNKFTFPVWLAQPLFDAVKPMGGIPLHWIVDSKGIVRWESVGFVKMKDEDWLNAVMAKVTAVQ